MKITRNVYPIVNLNNWMQAGELVIDHEYQRGEGLWPPNARTFFIDTILNEYPFPKVTLRQNIDLRMRKAILEVVDGQQRLTTIRDFLGGSLRLSRVSRRFAGNRFEDLPTDIRKDFLAYEVSVDTIVGASNSQVLEVFRRINSYTLPLNEPEKRHAEYQGDFKWFVLDLVELYSPLLQASKALTLRETARMQDADLLTELVELVTRGVVDRSPRALESLYKRNDKTFPERAVCEQYLAEAMGFVKDDLYRVVQSGMLSRHQFYSLIAALLYNRYGLRNVNAQEVGEQEPIHQFTVDTSRAVENILTLLSAAERRDVAGELSEFVLASLSSTHRKGNRLTRLKWFVSALQNGPFIHS